MECLSLNKSAITVANIEQNLENTLIYKNKMECSILNEKCHLFPNNCSNEKQKTLNK